MDSFKGIPIREYVLFVRYGIFIFLFTALLVAIGFYVYTLLSGRNPNSKKDREKIQNLKERAQSDTYAKAQLDRIERKNKRKRKRNRWNRIGEVAFSILLVGLCVIVLCFGILPPLSDHITKDYIVYTGEIKVLHQGRTYFIELEGGTALYGNGILGTDDTYGTVVYGKRSKLVIGGRK